MNFNNEYIPVYPSTSFDELAERSIISFMLELDLFKETKVQRRLASYPSAIEEEKNLIILELMEHFWGAYSTKKMFTVFRDFEKVFTILGGKGHFIHQFEVFLLGWYIIHSILVKRGEELIQNFNTYERIFYSWLFASTAHDFGYPLQIAGELAKKFSELYSNIHMNNLAKIYRKLNKGNYISKEKDLNILKVYNLLKKKDEFIDMDSFVLECISESYNNDLDSAKKVQRLLKKTDNHGYISAIIFCRLYIDYLSNEGWYGLSSEKWRIDDMKKVASAISLHAIPLKNKSFIKKINYNTNPILFLLFLVDNFQEWNRSLRLSDKWPAYSLKNFGASSNSIDLSYTLYHEKWDKPMVKRVQASLKDKATLLLQPKLPKPSLDLKITAYFSTNEGYDFKPIIIKL